MVLYFDVILAYRNERGTFAEAARIVVDAILSLRKKKKKSVYVLYLYYSISMFQESPTGPTERTPKPEYLIALATYLGVRW